MSFKNTRAEMRGDGFVKNVKSLIKINLQDLESKNNKKYKDD